MDKETNKRLDKQTNILDSIMSTIDELFEDKKNQDIVSNKAMVEQNKTFARMSQSIDNGYKYIANTINGLNNNSMYSMQNINDSVNALIGVNDKLLPSIQELDKPVLLEGTFVDITKKANLYEKTIRAQDKRQRIKDDKKKNKFEKSMFKSVVKAVGDSGQNVVRQLLLMTVIQSAMQGFFGAFGLGMDLVTKALSTGSSLVAGGITLSNKLLAKLLTKSDKSKPTVKGEVDFVDFKLDGAATMASMRKGLNRLLMRAVPMILPLLNPVTAIAAIAATAGVAIYNTFKTEFDNLFGEIGALITDPERLANMFKPLTDGALNLYNSAKQWFINAFVGIQDNFYSAVGSIGAFLDELGITSFFNNYFNIMRGAINGILGTFLSIPDYVSLLGIKISEVFLNMKAALNSGLQSAVKSIEESSVFKGINAAAEFFGADAIEFGDVNVFDGVEEQLAELKAQEETARANIEANKQDYVGIGYEAAVDVANKGVEAVVQTANNVVDGVVDSGQQAINAVSDGFETVIDSAKNLKGNISTSIDNLSSDISKLGIETLPEVSTASIIKHQVGSLETAQRADAIAANINTTIVGGSNQNNINQNTTTRAPLTTDGQSKKTRTNGAVQ